MNSPCWRKSLLGLAFLACFGSHSVALANRGLLATVFSPYAETVYVVPTSYVVPTTYLATSASYLYPSSYVYPTASYVYPSSYVYPTAYLASSYVVSPGSYVVPTYYTTTSSVVPRRYVARPVYSTALAYLPTTAYTPMVYPTIYTPTTYYDATVVDYPVVASSSTVCCAEAAPITPAPAAPRMSNSVDNERAPSSVVESVPYNEPSRPEEAPNPPTGSGSRPARSAPLDSSAPTPPVAPAPERETSSAPPPAAENLPVPDVVPAPSSEVNPPAAPPAAESSAPPPAEPAPTTFRRRAQKPVTPPIARPPGRGAFNTLAGKVVSSDTRQGEEGVRVIVSSRAGNFVDRVATTDASGQYALKLPDGDWTVKVAMPSGRVYAVSQITISGGQITDDVGRDIPSLIITR